MSNHSSGLLPALQQGIETLGLPLDAQQQDKLLRYIELLVQWNKVYNLTALRQPAEMLTHHVLDSLSVIAPLRRHTQGKPVQLLDVGSGGGLPGVVIAICCPEIQVTCVDAVAKKNSVYPASGGRSSLTQSASAPCPCGNDCNAPSHHHFARVCLLVGLYPMVCLCLGARRRMDGDERQTPRR